MREEFIDISEITYSREMYDAKPRPFVSAFIYLFLLILVVAFAWTYFGELDIVARGNGIVRPGENVNTLRTEASGKLQEVNVSEGTMVQKGDRLYVIEHEALSLQQHELEEKISDLQNKLISQKAYKESIMQGEALFAKPSTYNTFYETKYENYAANVNYLTYQQESTKLQLEKSDQSGMIRQQLNSSKSELERMQLLQQSILQGENLLAEGAYKVKYDEYTQVIGQYEADILYLTDTADKTAQLYDAGVVSKSEYETAERQLNTKLQEYDQYKTNYMATLQLSIEQAISSNGAYEAQLHNAKITAELLDNEDENGAAAAEKYRLDTLVALQDEIKADEEQLDNYEMSLQDVAIQLKSTIVTAPISGKVNLLSDVTEGDYISLGSELLTIIPENESGFTVDIALPNSEIAGIEVGDQVKFKFSALPFKEYGEFLGTIKEISTDIKSDKTGNSFYLVKASLADTEAVSYKGETRRIKVGMACEAHVIKEQKKVLYWLLEKINLKD